MTQSTICRLFDIIELLNVTICNTIHTATTNLHERQRPVGDAVLPTEADDDLYVIIRNVMAFLENETELLAEDLIEQLDDWFNETANLINIVEEEVTALPHTLMEAPIESFLQQESSLKCLAEYNNRKAVENMWHGLERILQCFHIGNDTERPFEMAKSLLSMAGGDIQLTLEEILRCHESTLREGYDTNDYGDMTSCYEMSKSILEAMQDFVDSKLDEIYFHVEISMYYNELKMESCVYYRAREMMLDVSEANHRYRKCNEKTQIEPY
uniref:Uncharacterized protein n=1 Tax=Anopheles epiroticus TaxID=199890 RepID=A0A182P011_9DIPT